MNFEMNRGFDSEMETDESATGYFADDEGFEMELCTPDSSEEGEQSYRGAAGTHNASGPLEILSLWGTPADNPKPQQNTQNARAQRSGSEEPLPIMDMKW